MKTKYKIFYKKYKTTDAHDGIVHKFLMIVKHQKNIMHIKFEIPELYKMLKEKSIRVYDGKNFVTAYKNDNFKLLCEFLNKSQKQILLEIWSKYNFAKLFV